MLIINALQLSGRVMTGCVPVAGWLIFMDLKKGLTWCKDTTWRWAVPNKDMHKMRGYISGVYKGLYFLLHKNAAKGCAC